MSKLTEAAEILPPPADLRTRPICRRQSASISQPCHTVEAADSSTNWKSSGTANVNISRSKINAIRHPTPSVNDEGIKTARDIFTPETVILMQEFPENVDVIFIIITKPTSPGNFYWYFHNKHNDIKKLARDMTNFYSPNYGQLVLKKEMYLGMLVAVKFHDYFWYRARVVRSCGHDEFEVFLVDIGQFVIISIDDLHHLSERFTKLPMQAFCGKMFGIHPYPDANEWSAASCKQFWELVKDDKIIAAKVVSAEEEEPNRVFVLHLVKLSNDGKDLPLDDFLVDNGMAEYDSDKIPSDLLPVSTYTDQDVEALSAPNNLASTWSPTSAKPKQYDRQSFVKQLSFSDGRKVHIVRDEDELFIPEFDLKLILPSLDRQLTINKIKINSVKIINDESHPHVFIDALRLKAVWMRNEDNGTATEEIKLYPLHIVPSFIFLFNKNMEKEALYVIENELKNFKKYETVTNGETNRMSLSTIRKIN